MLPFASEEARAPETRGAVDRVGRLRGADRDVHADGVIGGGLQIVGSREKRGQTAFQARFVSRDSSKLAAHARVGFRDLVRSQHDDRLRRMESRKVGGAARRCVETNDHDGLSLVQRLTRLIEISARIAYKSRPSRVSSSMNAVGSRSRPAVSGNALMTAPVS